MIIVLSLFTASMFFISCGDCGCTSDCSCKKKECECKECSGWSGKTLCICYYKSLYGDCGLSESTYKGRNISISELDQGLFNEFNQQRRSLGKEEIKFSKVIYELAFQDANQQITDEIKETLWKYFCATAYHYCRYPLNDWYLSSSDTLSYQNYVKDHILSQINLDNDYDYNFDYGAIASYNTNGSWVCDIILVNSKKY